MHLVDGHRVFFLVEFHPVLHPGFILPHIAADIGYAGSGAGTHLCLICIRIGLEKILPMHPFNVEFVQLPDLRARDKSLPHTDGACLFHGRSDGIPPVKLSDHGDRLGVGSPHGKINASLPVLLCGMSSQFFVNIIVCCLSKEILVKFGKFHTFFLLWLPTGRSGPTRL